MADGPHVALRGDAKRDSPALQCPHAPFARSLALQSMQPAGGRDIAHRESGPSSAARISRRRRTRAGVTPRESPRWNSRSAAPRLKLSVAKPSVDQDKVRSSSEPGNPPISRPRRPASCNPRRTGRAGSAAGGVRGWLLRPVARRIVVPRRSPTRSATRPRGGGQEKRFRRSQGRVPGDTANGGCWMCGAHGGSAGAVRTGTRCEAPNAVCGRAARARETRVDAGDGGPDAASA